MNTVIRITSKRHGFRRCGIEHPSTPTIYPNDRFTADELARLKAEPMLIVEELPDPEPEGDGNEAHGDGEAAAPPPAGKGGKKKSD